MKQNDSPYLMVFILVFSSCVTNKVPLAPIPKTFLNKDPIILLHGLNGFSREEYEDFYYWGGKTDLERELKAAGYDVRTAAVGPLSSNWDRSCELYACIKGGQVDYGEIHSQKAGHNRYGRVYEGLYPEWGTIDEETGKPRRVHIIAHSMGGMTARMTAQLLARGNPVEKENTENISPLFLGEKDWIKSIMTLSTPHDGTTLTYEFTSYRQRDLIIYLALGFMIDWGDSFFLHNDLQLDHWPFMAYELNERDEDYRARLSRIIEKWDWNNKDFSDYDLTPEGAWEMNGWVHAQPNIYYFSWRTRITEEKDGEPPAIHPGITPFLIPLTNYLMTYGGYRSSMINIDARWFSNDGVVNCLSQDGPKLNSTDQINPFSGKAIPGIWNSMGELYPLDHAQVLGWNQSLFTPPEFKDMRQWYLDQAALLTALP